MKIRLVMLGKTRREEARALLEDYVDRIAAMQKSKSSNCARLRPPRCAN